MVDPFDDLNLRHEVGEGLRGLGLHELPVKDYLGLCGLAWDLVSLLGLQGVAVEGAPAEVVDNPGWWGYRGADLQFPIVGVKDRLVCGGYSDLGHLL
jgi:hypothetical protein